MTDPKHIVVLGGGITGLSAAHALASRARASGRAVRVTVLEGSGRLGGNLVTMREGGFVLDGGPDSWVSSKPQATALAKELGLEGALVGTNPHNRRYFVAWGEELHPVPEGLVLGVPTRLMPLAASRLFTWRGKARMAMEPFVPARRGGPEDDESIASFAARRLGKEAADRLVAPLLGGISAGDANDISLRAAFPQLAAMEAKHGSLVRGMIAAKRARPEGGKPNGDGASPAPAGAGSKPGAPSSAFVSLRGGVGDLVVALARRLEEEGVTVRTNARAAALARDERGGWTVRTADGETLHADAVLVAVPAHVASGLLRPIDPSVADRLADIRFGSTATVFLGYRRGEVKHPLDGVGFVVPRSQGRPILAGTWVSSKWDDRAPQGHVLVRAFFGGAWGEGVLDRDDAGLVELARDELSGLMGLHAEPVLARVFRFHRATAQMRVGHLSSMASTKARLAEVAPGLLLAGGGYDGVGIPDCVRQAQQAAGELLADAARC
jgi:oxygen-dependent protoporphyrinogen oxidase